MARRLKITENGIEKIYLYYRKKDGGIGEKWPNLDVCVSNLIFTCHRYENTFTCCQLIGCLFHDVDEKQQQVRWDTSMGLAAGGYGNNRWDWEVNVNKTSFFSLVRDNICTWAAVSACPCCPAYWSTCMCMLLLFVYLVSNKRLIDWLNLGVRMNSWEWDGVGLIKTFLLIWNS